MRATSRSRFFSIRNAYRTHIDDRSLYVYGGLCNQQLWDRLPRLKLFTSAQQCTMYHRRFQPTYFQQRRVRAVFTTKAKENSQHGRLRQRSLRPRQSSIKGLSVQREQGPPLPPTKRNPTEGPLRSAPY